MPAELIDGRLLGAGWIEFGLEPRIQLTDPERAAVHWAEDLNVANGIESELFRDARADHIEQRAGNMLGVGTFEKIKVRVGFQPRDFGHKAFIDAVGIGDDAAVGGLAEYLGQTHDRDHAAIDQTAEDHAGPDRWELVHVADQD